MTKGKLVETFVCDETGNWYPPLDVIKCVGMFHSNDGHRKFATLRNILTKSPLQKVHIEIYRK